MSKRQEDRITLASNVNLIGENNTIAHFKTRLTKRFNYPAEQDWRVALTKMTYKRNWYNVTQKTEVIFYNQYGWRNDFKDGDKFLRVFIPASYYRTPEDLIGKINDKIDDLKFIFDFLPKLNIDPHSRMVSLNPGTIIETRVKILPTFGKEIEEMLGLTNEDGQTLSEQVSVLTEEMQVGGTMEDNLKLNEKVEEINNKFNNLLFEGFTVADVKIAIQNLFIYTDLVQQSCVGDAFAPLLTFIPNEEPKDGSANGQVYYEPGNMLYMPMQSRIFDTVEIDIRDDRGLSIPFQRGNVVLHLDFLRYGE